MNLVCEMDLADMGSVCGVMGDMSNFRRDEFTKVLEKAGCNGVMFCFRGEDDLAIAEMVKLFTCERRYYRSIMIYNPSFVYSMKPEIQVYLERLLDQVDMVMQLQWDVEELPVAVAVHSGHLVIADKKSEADIIGILDEIDYQGRITRL